MPRLGGSEPRSRKRLDCLVGHIPLRTGKRRGIAIPAQTSADIRVYAAAFRCELIRDAMQLVHLVKQRLELLLVDRATLLLVRVPKVDS